MALQKLIVPATYAQDFKELGETERLPEFGLVSYRFDATGKGLAAWKERCRSLHQRKVSAICLPQRRYRAVFFDMDSTAIAQESIVELARAAGKAEEVAHITERAMAGELDFAAALRERVRMLKGLPAEVIDVVGKSLTTNPGLPEFAAWAQKRGIQLFLVSGGFVPLAAGLARDLGFAGFHANQLEIVSGRLSGEVLGAIVDADAKAAFLRATCQRLGIAPTDVIAVGDGANDLPMLREAGAAIGFCPKELLLPHLDGALYDDHRALIPSCMD